MTNRDESDAVEHDQDLQLAQLLKMSQHAQRAAVRVLQEHHEEIERLRAEREEDQGVIAVWRGRTQRAEAEIERLREALRSIAGNGCCDRCQEAALVARSALKKGERLPTPPEECQTESEKKAFAFGYWSGVAAIRARGEKP